MKYTLAVVLLVLPAIAQGQNQAQSVVYSVCLTKPGRWHAIEQANGDSSLNSNYYYPPETEGLNRVLTGALGLLTATSVETTYEIDMLCGKIDLEQAAIQQLSLDVFTLQRTVRELSTEISALKQQSTKTQQAAK